MVHVPFTERPSIETAMTDPAFAIVPIAEIAEAYRMLQRCIITFSFIIIRLLEFL